MSGPRDDAQKLGRRYLESDSFLSAQKRYVPSMINHILKIFFPKNAKPDIRPIVTTFPLPIGILFAYISAAVIIITSPTLAKVGPTPANSK